MASNIDEYEFTLVIDLLPEITTQNNENIEITTLSPINENVEQSNRHNSSYSPRCHTPSSSLSSDDDYDENAPAPPHDNDYDDENDYSSSVIPYTVS